MLQPQSESETPVAEVRAFNRIVTERIGALQDEYLARGRPLGASRLLWEIGDGADVRTLRTRLALDSGYVSRLLRGLEAEGLVVLGANPEDRRVRAASLTPKGKRERAVLDERSDALAEAILAPLSDGQRGRLLGAMAEVERLLTASVVEVKLADPGDPDARRCLEEYFRELAQRFEQGYDPSAASPASGDDLRAPTGLLLVATLRGEAVACGGLTAHAADRGELRRMWVDATVRGLGVGRRMLAELEAHARDLGITTLQIETNERLIEAIAMYRSAGYAAIPRFNPAGEPYATHWFQKSLS